MKQITDNSDNNQNKITKNQKNNDQNDSKKLTKNQKKRLQKQRSKTKKQQIAIEKKQQKQPTSLHTVTNFKAILKEEIQNKNKVTKNSQICDIQKDQNQLKSNTKKIEKNKDIFEKPNPEIEILRLKKYQKLEKHFNQICQDNNIQPPQNAFDRWIFQSKLNDNEQKKNSKNKNTVTDPLLPNTENYVDQNLIQDLQRQQIDLKQAQKMALEMSQKSVSFIKEIYTEYKINQQKNKNNFTGKVYLQRHKHTLDLFFSIDGGKTPIMKKIMKLNPKHYQKLQQLYQFKNKNIDHNNEKKEQNDEMIDEDEKEQEFIEILFCLLLRYHTLQGHGFQAALNEDSFNVLKQRMDLDFECFASPLNCYFGNFCSVFEDIDSFFGSSGSFFNFYPQQGSFEANPPFIPYFISKMVIHIEQIFENQENKSLPLSFSIIVPGWKESEFWKQLETSKYKKKAIFISKKEHGYCDGAQHQRNYRYRESPYDTAVFIFQNEAGFQKWRVNSQVEQEFRNAMSKAVPSEMMLQKQTQQKNRSRKNNQQK